MRVEQTDLNTYGTLLPSSGVEAFHTPEALEVVDRHTSGDLRLYAGYKGEQAVALLPLFVRTQPFGTVATSPPPSFSIPHLGPILMPTSPKRSKRERLNRKFTRGVLETVIGDGIVDLFRMTAAPRYRDPRPYRWTGLDVHTSFTYRLDIDVPSFDAINGQFSKALRREMRKGDELDVHIEAEGIHGARQIYDDISARYDEQDEAFGVTWPFVRDLVNALDDRTQSFVARDGDGDYLGGIIALYGSETMYYWQGGSRASYDGISVNSLLHRALIRDAIENREDVVEYDLVGANTERLCDYKAKFGAELVPYYTIESSGLGMEIAKRAYQLVNR